MVAPSQVALPAPVTVSDVSLPHTPRNITRGSMLLTPRTAKAELIGRVGVCALDVKARSKASRNILTRLQGNGELDVVIFGDKVILDEGEFARTRRYFFD